MAALRLQVIDREGNVICESAGEGFTDLVCEHVYQEGDRIRLISSQYDT